MDKRESISAEKKSLPLQLLLSAIGLAITGLAGTFLGKVIDRWGVLDGPANQLGDWLKANVDAGDLSLIVGLILAAFAYAVLLWFVWRGRGTASKGNAPNVVRTPTERDDNQPIPSLADDHSETVQKANERTAHSALSAITGGSLAAISEEAEKDWRAQREADRQRLIAESKREARSAATFDQAFADNATDEIPYVRIRHIIHEYGLSLAATYPGSSNVAYDIERELRQAAVDGQVKVRGRKYRGPVQDNDPLVSIPASHFEEYTFKHGCLHYEVPNVQSATARPLTSEGQLQVKDATFYDLKVGYADTRQILKRVAEAALIRSRRSISAAIRMDAEICLSWVTRKIDYAQKARSRNGDYLNVTWLGKLKAGDQNIELDQLESHRDNARTSLSEEHYRDFSAAIDEIKQLNRVAAIAQDSSFDATHMVNTFLDRAAKVKPALLRLIEELPNGN